MAVVALRTDYDAAGLRGLAKVSKSAGATRQLLALAEIYDAGSRTDAARIGGVGLQTVRDWVLRCNAQGPDALIDGKAPGPRSKLDDEHRRALIAMIEAGPIPAIHGVVRRRLIDLAQWVYDEYRISVTKQILSRERSATASSRRARAITPRTRRQPSFFRRASPPWWQPSKRRPAASR